MLVPRPEIRMATRVGSRMVAGGPLVIRTPAAGGAAHRAATLAVFDCADAVNRLAAPRQGLGGSIGFGLGDDGHHPDAAVESACHLGCGEGSTLLKASEDRRQGPGCHIYYSVVSIG